MSYFAPASAAFLLMTLTLAASGCEGGPKVPATVHGQVAYRGVPLSSGTIVFVPDALRGTTGPLASGTIQPDGSYSLRAEDGAGVPPGWHRVTVCVLEGSPGGTGVERFAAPRSVLPDKYRDPDLSGLSCEVKAGQDNRIDFHLE